MKDQTKIFGIGLSRTGTTSLAKALEILGYKSKHFPGEILYNTPIIVRTRIFLNKIIKKILPRTNWRLKEITRYTKNRLLLNKKIVEEYDALTDTPITRFYKELDKLFPKSKFILTTRNMEDWLNSCEKFLDKNKFEEAFQLNKEIYNSSEFNRKKFKQTRINHQKEVLEYFKNRKKELLIMNISGGDGWGKLCKFLDKPIPQEKFPYENKFTMRKK